jgi:hypothetical protein
MNREGAETYLRLVAEAELRGPMPPARLQPWAGLSGLTARLASVAQALTAVHALDDETEADILAGFDLAVTVRQPPDRAVSGPLGAAGPRPARLMFPSPGLGARGSRLGRPCQWGDRRARRRRDRGQGRDRGRGRDRGQGVRT